MLKPQANLVKAQRTGPRQQVRRVFTEKFNPRIEVWFVFAHMVTQKWSWHGFSNKIGSTKMFQIISGVCTNENRAHKRFHQKCSFRSKMSYRAVRHIHWSFFAPRHLFSFWTVWASFDRSHF